MTRKATAQFMWPHPARWIALGFGSGLSPKAPGTVGTLWAWLAFWALGLIFPAWGDREWLVCIAASTLVGWWACTRCAQHLHVADPGVAKGGSASAETKADTKAAAGKGKSRSSRAGAGCTSAVRMTACDGPAAARLTLAQPDWSTQVVVFQCVVTALRAGTPFDNGDAPPRLGVRDARRLSFAQEPSPCRRSSVSTSEPPTPSCP